MMKVRFPLRLGAPLAVAMMATACAIPDIEQGSYINLTEERGELVVGADAFIGTTPTRIGFVDFLQREEYTLYRSPKGQAELLYLRSRPERTQYTSLAFNKLIARTLPMWRFNQGHPLNLGESFFLRTTLAPFWVQPYTQTDTGRNCAGLYGAWDEDSLDPWQRPRKIVFGYYCVPAGEKLTAEDAKHFVTSIDIRGITLPLQIKTAYELRAGDPPIPPRAEQVKSLVIVEDGLAGGVAGIPDFPILAARSYTPADGECRRNC